MSARQTAAPAADRWVSAAIAAEISGFSESHLARLRMQGAGPRYAKLGTGKQAHVRYRESELHAWMASHLVANTSEVAPCG
ncbi:MAG TPA: helix-turn-helix domain-containing protein [Polyangiales bacterium]